MPKHLETRVSALFANEQLMLVPLAYAVRCGGVVSSISTPAPDSKGAEAIDMWHQNNGGSFVIGVLESIAIKSDVRRDLNHRRPSATSHWPAVRLRVFNAERQRLCHRALPSQSHCLQ